MSYADTLDENPTNEKSFDVVTSKKKKCLHCGNNQTSHVGAWVDSFIFLSINPVSQKIFRTRIGHYLYWFTDNIIEYVIKVLAYVGVIRFSGQHQDAPSDRGRVLCEEAVARRWNMETVLFLGRAIDMYRITFSDGQQFIFSGLPRPHSRDDATAGWIDDKALLKQCLMGGDVPVPQGKNVGDWKSAERVFNELQKPVIVKPRLGSRGRHTTTHISSIDDFKTAFNSAKKLCKEVVVEEHLEGSVYRATVIDGELAGVLAGDPPRITGDGSKTIAELIELKNRQRPSTVGLVVFTDTLITFLERLGYALDDVLDNKVIIDLSEKIGLSYGGNSREVTPDVHPKLRNELERAAKAVDDPLLGFDFITQDVSSDPDTMRWGIIECNASPFINLHHDPHEGLPVNVAAKVLDYVERNRHLLGRM
ncbi:MAG: hypothetical protein K9M10_04170 [Candidatus Pacebacteria bacterium]|nr:hypothetical protein [Candidatus Paceibacterota bacterium]MCF7857640.1 hypothetical protein [Candidatus Paceibacterota bacterium]